MSGHADGGRRRQAPGHAASIFGDGRSATKGASGGAGDVRDVDADSLEDRLRAEANDARRQRDLFATKVALLAYKLQMNSHERCRRHRHQHQQLCQANYCTGRSVWGGIAAHELCPVSRLDELNSLEIAENIIALSEPFKSIQIIQCQWFVSELLVELDNACLSVKIQ